MDLSFRTHRYEYIAGILLLVFCAPLLIHPADVKFLMHDNLDSNLVWYSNLAHSGKMFAANTALVENTMLGIPRACYPSEWAIDHLLYLILKPQAAYSLIYIFLHIMAYIGMRLFLKETIASSHPAVYNLVALSFAFLPFWPSGFMTVAGLPFMAVALYKICNDKDTWLHWTIVLVFPFCSSLLFGNLFSYPLLFVAYIIGLVNKNWKFRFKNFLPFILLFVLTALVEYRIVSLVLSDFESNRAADVPTVTQFMNYKGIIGTGIRAFLFGHYHFHSFQVFIAVFSLCSIAWMAIKKKGKEFRISLLLMACIFIFALLMVFLDNYDLRTLLGQNYKRLELRLWVAFPIMWYSIFAMVLVKLKGTAMEKAILPAAIVQVVFTMCMLYPRDYFGSRYAENVFANTFIHKNNPEQTRFGEYYRIYEFENLKKAVPDIKTKAVATIGINPEIVQFNGIKTIEGYFSFYPLAKRKMILEIDNSERNKSSENLNKHSNRNYLFVHEPESNKTPDWDFKRLKSLGVEYLITDRSIASSDSTLINLVSENYLFLYQIK